MPRSTTGATPRSQTEYQAGTNNEQNRMTRSKTQKANNGRTIANIRDDARQSHTAKASSSRRSQVDKNRSISRATASEDQKVSTRSSEYEGLFVNVKGQKTTTTNSDGSTTTVRKLAASGLPSKITSPIHNNLCKVGISTAAFVMSGFNPVVPFATYCAVAGAESITNKLIDRAIKGVTLTTATHFNPNGNVGASTSIIATPSNATQNVTPIEVTSPEEAVNSDDETDEMDTSENNISLDEQIRQQQASLQKQIDELRRLQSQNS